MIDKMWWKNFHEKAFLQDMVDWDLKKKRRKKEEKKKKIKNVCNC